MRAEKIQAALVRKVQERVRQAQLWHTSEHTNAWRASEKSRTGKRGHGKRAIRAGGAGRLIGTNVLISWLTRLAGHSFDQMFLNFN